MASRIRPTVPYSGSLPHREHRSPKGRDRDYRWKRDRKAKEALASRKEKAREKQRLRMKARNYGW